jgi:hypothetical protein
VEAVGAKRRIPTLVALAKTSPDAGQTLSLPQPRSYLPWLTAAVVLGALDLKPKYAEALVGDKNMRGVSTLLAESLDVSTDRLRTFLFTYIALEILIHKAFSVYEQKFVHELTSGSTVPGTARYFDRIKNVMQGKYNPVDKFTIIASLLSGESSDEHIEQFKRIKGIRDRLVHTGKYEEDSLPNIELRELLIGYLRRHLHYISQ